MASSRPVDFLLTDLGKAMGMKALVFDDNDGCLLQFDDTMTVLLLYDKNANVLYFFSYIGEINTQSLAIVAVQLLEANYRWMETGGATLSIRPQSGKDVVLTRKVSVSDLQSSDLQGYLGEFVTSIEKWTKFLADHQNATSIGTPTTDKARSNTAKTSLPQATSMSGPALRA